MMQYRELKPGDSVPFDYPRRPFTGSCDPAWWVMTTGRMRQDMVGAAAWLRRVGADEAWFPEEEVRRTTKRGNVLVREKYARPIVPGVVFVLSASWPQWDVIAERKRIRPLKIGDKPVAVTEHVMAKMENVPQRIEDLRKSVAAAEKAEREARIPKVGDAVSFFGNRALVEDIGPQGFLVTWGGKKVWLPEGTEKVR